MVGRQNRSLTTKQGRGGHQRAETVASFEVAAAVQAVALPQGVNDCRSRESSMSSSSSSSSSSSLLSSASDEMQSSIEKESVAEGVLSWEKDSHPIVNADGQNVKTFAKWNDARLNIINQLNTVASDIHILLTVRGTKKEVCTLIWKKYASNHPEKMCVDSIGRLLIDFSKGSGPHFGEKSGENDGKPVWKSRKIISKGWSLLYQLRMRAHGTAVSMTTEQIYKLHSIFHQYDLKDFKKYDKDMKKLTDKHRNEVNENIQLWKKHRQKFPTKSQTSRGKLFWCDHPAKKKLREDTKSGKTKIDTPKELWEGCDEYKQFSLEDFRKHIYQEKYLQLAGPYWQKKRNKLAMKEHDEAVEQMYNEWHHAKYKSDMDELIEGVKNM